mgnify:FL=1|jgi:hypothetical protein
MTVLYVIQVMWLVAAFGVAVGSLRATWLEW